MGMQLLFVLACGVWSYWANAHSFSLWMWGRDAPDNDWQAGIWMFVAGVVGGQIALYFLVMPFTAIASRFSFKGKLGNIGSTQFGRSLFGLLANLFAFLVASSWPMALTLSVIIVGGLIHGDGFLETEFRVGWPILAVQVVVSICAGFYGKTATKTRIARAGLWVADKFQGLSFGFGGSASFTGILDDWARPWHPRDLALGASLYDRKWMVGPSDDRHFVTIATSRAGKGTSGIIPNLLTWPGSVLCIDPKGENAAITAEARRKMGQAVHIIDPFGVLADVGVSDPVSRYNPLAELDPMDGKIYENLEAVADSLVKPDPKGENVWDESTLYLLVGLIAHAVTWPLLPDSKRNLGQVQDWLTQPGGPPFADMLKNPLPGGIPEAVAGSFMQLEEKFKSGILGTARTHTKWLNSPALRASLAASDFSIADLKRQPATIYVVIPPDYLRMHGRWLRLFINTAMSACMRDAQKAPHDILFVMDEFYSLGRMERMEGAAAALGGYGVKLWPIVQNVGQLQQLYKENWETFLGNAGMWQVFACNDETTARYFSDRLGPHVRWRRVEGVDGPEWMALGPNAFRTPVEVQRETSRRGGRQFIYQEGGECTFLRRVTYFDRFPKSAYRKNPFNERTIYRPPPAEAAAAREQEKADAAGPIPAVAGATGLRRPVFVEPVALPPPAPSSEAPPDAVTDSPAPSDPPPRKRGRPRKTPPPVDKKNVSGAE